MASEHAYFFYAAFFHFCFELRVVVEEDCGVYVFAGHCCHVVAGIYGVAFFEVCGYVGAGFFIALPPVFGGYCVGYGCFVEDEDVAFFEGAGDFFCVGEELVGVAGVVSVGVVGESDVVFFEVVFFCKEYPGGVCYFFKEEFVECFFSGEYFGFGGVCCVCGFPSLFYGVFKDFDIVAADDVKAGVFVKEGDEGFKVLRVYFVVCIGKEDVCAACAGKSAVSCGSGAGVAADVDYEVVVCLCFFFKDFKGVVGGFFVIGDDDFKSGVCLAEEVCEGGFDVAGCVVGRDYDGYLRRRNRFFVIFVYNISSCVSQFSSPSSLLYSKGTLRC